MSPGPTTTRRSASGPCHAGRMAAPQLIPPPRSRTRLALAAAATVAVGLLARVGLRGIPGTAAWTGPLGDALYAVLVFLLLAWAVPRARTRTLTAAAFGVCAAIELFQLTGVPAALGQAFPPARLVLGTGFLWSDLVLYGMGVAAAAAMDAALRRRRAGRHAAPSRRAP